MFSVFREWWILKQLRKKCRKGDAKLVLQGITNQDTIVPQTTFLKGITEKMFWFIPRSIEQQNARVARDKKLLQRSRDRIPPFIKEETYLEMCKRILASGKVKDHLNENGITDEQITWSGTQSIKDDIYIKTTGDGDNFTFPVACSEFVSKHYLFFSVIIAILLFLASPWSPKVRQWYTNFVIYDQPKTEISQPTQ